MRSRAYVETSIPSFYFETRPEAEKVARANANKFGHIRRVNSLLGLLSPSLVTPVTAGLIASVPGRTNGNPGGKHPRGNRASRSPARRYSAASRKALANQA